jgi:TolB-like protein
MPARLILCLVLILLLCSTLSSAASKQRIAVLDLANRAEIHEREVDYIGDLVRSAVRRSLGTNDFIVMTRENILELLPEGQTLSDCEGECAVQTGREVGADYVISGEMILFSDEYRVSLQLYDTEEGNLLNTRMAGGPSLLTLEQPINVGAGALCSVIGGRTVEPVDVVRQADPVDSMNRDVVRSASDMRERAGRKKWTYKGKYELSLGAGDHDPRGTFGDFWEDDGPEPSIEIGFYPTRNLAFNIRGGGNNYSLKNNFEDPNTYDPGIHGPWSGTSMVVSVYEVTAKFLLKDGASGSLVSASPYIKAGAYMCTSSVEIARYWSSIETERDKRYETDYFNGTGWMAGGGVQFRFWHLGASLELMYMSKLTPTVDQTDELDLLDSFSIDHDPYEIEPDMLKLQLSFTGWFGS